MIKLPTVGNRKQQLKNKTTGWKKSTPEKSRLEPVCVDFLQWCKKEKILDFQETFLFWLRV